jgi:hypothetical protein
MKTVLLLTLLLGGCVTYRNDIPDNAYPENWKPAHERWVPCDHNPTSCKQLIGSDK